METWQQSNRLQAPIFCFGEESKRKQRLSRAEIVFALTAAICFRHILLLLLFALGMFYFEKEVPVDPSGYAPEKAV